MALIISYPVEICTLSVPGLLPSDPVVRRRHVRGPVSSVGVIVGSDDGGFVRGASSGVD